MRSVDNVKNISADMVTPLDVLTDLQAKLTSISQVYVVAFIDGRPTIWASGNIKSMALAATAMQMKVMDFLNE